eukprot:ANDGO_04003.mRNA.1 hypothetical protein
MIARASRMLKHRLDRVSNSSLENLYIGYVILCTVLLLHSLVLFSTFTQASTMTRVLGNVGLLVLPALGFAGLYWSSRPVVVFFAVSQLVLAVLVIVYLAFAVRDLEQCQNSVAACSFASNASAIVSVSLLSMTSLLLVLSAIFAAAYAILMPRIEAWRRARNLFIRSMRDKKWTAVEMAKRGIRAISASTSSMLKKAAHLGSSPSGHLSHSGSPFISAEISSPFEDSSPAFPVRGTDAEA